MISRAANNVDDVYVHYQLRLIYPYISQMGYTGSLHPSLLDCLPSSFFLDVSANPICVLPAPVTNTHRSPIQLKESSSTGAPSHISD